MTSARSLRLSTSILAAGIALFTLAGCSSLPGGDTGIVSRPQAEAREARGGGTEGAGADGSGGAAAAPGTGGFVTAPPVVQTTAPATAAGAATVMQPAGQSVAALDTASPEERAAAEAPPAGGEQRLGTTIASLGDATEPGFWIKTPLVQASAKGRVVNPENGRSANVDLLPLPGPSTAGSQLSLAAIQSLGISLTDLPEVEVWRN